MISASKPLPQMDAETFATLAKIARQEAGLHLPDSKKSMLIARLQRRLKKLNLASFDAYVTLLKQDDAQAQEERHALICALTTNVTQFFREAHHFDHLRHEILPELSKRAKSGARIRIWSAGCSSGQEAYSIAATCRNHAPALLQGDFRILATDIDTDVLAQARRAIYSVPDLEESVRTRLEPYLEPLENAQFRIKPELRDWIQFSRLNLLSEWPFQGGFDVIFCRNVAIYFDQETQDRLFHALAARLHPKGWLYIGHSERIRACGAPIFTSAGHTTYQKICA